jgi:hypothetical protein
VLLCQLPGLVDGFAALSGAFCEFLCFGLDLGVETLEDGKDGAFEDFGGFVVGIGDALTPLARFLYRYG